MTGAIAQNNSQKNQQTQTQNYAQRADVDAFVRRLAEQRHMDEAWLRASLHQSRFNPTVQRLMTPPSGPAGIKNWRTYRSRFVEPLRIRAGLRFWHDNAATLAQAEQRFGVPAEIIVGIIGVETIYGQQMGRFPVIDALATLAFDYPASHPRASERAAYFQRELAQFLSTAYLNDTNPFEPRGSYAGAMGMPQFMPSSWSEYAIDFDGDGKIDLFASSADAIGSVAHYLQAHGWQRDMPCTYSVRMNGTGEQINEPTAAQLADLLKPDIKPSFSAAQMAANGVHLLPPGTNAAGPLALIELKNGSDAPQYVAGTQNFYAITRYNNSSFYAMSVIELGQAIAQARATNTAIPSNEIHNALQAVAAARAYLRTKTTPPPPSDSPVHESGLAY